MAANDPDQRSDDPPGGDEPPRGDDRGGGCLSASGLQARLEEEINRAARHGTSLSCLVVSIDDLEELALRHGEQLPAQAIAYAGPTLRGELRSFDRVGRPSQGELLVLLPGADGPRGEIVARRLIDRLRAIKVEAAGVRRSLRISIGLAAWREELSAEQLIENARAAARKERNGLGNGLANGLAPT